MKYKLVWIACFSDGTKIDQFDDVEQTQEHLFKEVLERQDKLVLFCLFNCVTEEFYKVDLVNGAIIIGNVLELAQDHINNIKKNRLIYFRRVLKEIQIGKTIEEELKQITYFIGFQYTENERNIKKLIQIYDDGKVVVY